MMVITSILDYLLRYIYACKTYWPWKSKFMVGFQFTVSWADLSQGETVSLQLEWEFGVIVFAEKNILNMQVQDSSVPP